MGHRAWVEQIMGMPISIAVRGPNVASAADREAGLLPGTGGEHTGEAEVDALVAAAFDELRWVDDVFSMWQEPSPMQRHSAGQLGVEDCPPEVAHVLELCDEARRRTQGWFTHLLPAYTLPLYGGPAVGVGSADATAVPILTVGGEDPYALRLNPTGLVKGWGIARATTRLGELRGHAYCINAGGDIAVGGVDASDGGDRPWRLGVENPHDRSQIAEVVELREGAMATSGAAARGAHIIDPTTGRGLPHAGSVTVVGTDVMWADVWATALFAGPELLEEQLRATVKDAEQWRVVRL